MADVQIRARWIKEISSRKQGSSPTKRDMFHRGLYYEQLQRILSHFPREQLHVVISERFKSSPCHVVEGVRRFFGLPTQSSEVSVADKHIRQNCSTKLTPEERHELRALYADDVA